jgi:hypothetical protein
MIGWLLTVEVPNWAVIALAAMSTVAGFWAGRVVELRQWIRQ